MKTRSENQGKNFVSSWLINLLNLISNGGQKSLPTLQHFYKLQTNGELFSRAVYLVKHAVISKMLVLRDIPATELIDFH